jgi:exodeoxyribonuclease VIII
MSVTIHEMPAHEYFAAPAVSNSLLNSMNKSPAHCWALHLDPNRPPKAEPTPAMLAGTLAHCVILEPDAFPIRYVVKPDGMDYRTKDGKAWRDAQTGEVITLEQYDTAQAQRAAVLAVPEVAHALSSGEAELSIFWDDQISGERCKARLDWLHRLPDGRVIVLDLKTCSDASPAEFGRSVWNWGYHRQAALYSAGVEARGLEVAAFLFVAVTNAYPFIAVPYLLDDQAQQKGKDEVRALIDAFAQCKAQSKWPAYGDGVQTLSLPAWAK